MSLSHSYFNKLKLHEKFELLHSEGEFIASRQTEGYFVHLFSLENEYVEMWMSIELNHLTWIEILNNKEILKLYSDQFDIRKDLGL